MFLYMFAFMITSVVEQAFFVNKACLVNNNFTADICDNLNEYPEIKKQVQVSCGFVLLRVWVFVDVGGKLKCFSCFCLFFRLQRRHFINGRTYQHILCLSFWLCSLDRGRTEEEGKYHCWWAYLENSFILVWWSLMLPRVSWFWFYVRHCIVRFYCFVSFLNLIEMRM